MRGEFSYEAGSIIFTVVLFLLVGIVLKAAVADGFIAATVPGEGFSNSVSVNPALTNITITQAETFTPPLCSNLGDVPLLSDLGCLGAFVFWLGGLPKLTTEFIWINYLILVPMSIAVAFAIARLIKP